MGREWYLNWGTKSSSKKVKATTKSGGVDGGSEGGYTGGGYRKAVGKTTTPPVSITTTATTATVGGCMNAVLNMFDFQHFHLCLHPQDTSFIPEDLTPLKGLEAPRNSLESISEEEKDYSLHIQKDIQINTNRRDTGLKLVQVTRGGKIEDFSSECSNSPSSVRTPTLVARLMGLDMLPESTNSTPRSSLHSQISPHIKTPTTAVTTTTTTTKKTRTTTMRRSRDIVDHPRLSLQINNKENSIVKEMELSRPSCSAISTKRKDLRNNNEDEVSKSPSYYARQIMKQVKESVSRRVGMDITNTIGGANREHRRDQHLLSTTLKESKKPKKINKKDHNQQKENQILQEVKQVVSQKNVEIENNKTLLGSEKKLDSFGNKTSTSLVNKKPLMKSYDSIRNKKDEQFIRPSLNSTMGKRRKNTMLSSELLHGTRPSLVPLKKDTHHSKSLAKEGASSHVMPSKPIIKNITTGPTMTKTTTTTTIRRLPCNPIYEKNRLDSYWRSQKEATSTSIMEFQYITRILKCSGIDRDTPISFMRWYLPSQPLDPSIFHTLEATHYLTTSDKFASDKLNLSINRKLIFHLVDELLVEILKPNVKDHYYHHHNHHHLDHHQKINGFQLVKILCSKIRSFPSEDCQTLQDIDALVEKDMPKFGGANNMIIFEDDSEEIVLEIEEHIIDSLLQEILFYV